MNLLEFNDCLIKKRGKSVVSVPEITDEDRMLFNDLILCNNSVLNTFNKCTLDTEFYGVYPDIKKIVGKDKAVELFYAYKMNTYFPGIPNKIPYVLKIAVAKYGNVNSNMVLNSVLQYLTPYASDVYVVDGEEYTVKDILENVTGKNATLLTDSVRKVRTSVKNTYEFYVQDVDRVLVAPEDIADCISNEDAYNLSYDRERGVVLNDIPVRTLNNHIGVTQFDFNLTECI